MDENENGKVCLVSTELQQIQRAREIPVITLVKSYNHFFQYMTKQLANGNSFGI